MSRLNNNTHLLVFKIVTILWLAGWFIKLPFFWPYLTQTAFTHPAVFEFFPSFFRSPAVSVMFYFLPLVSLIALTKEDLKWYKTASLLMLISSLVLMLHINTYNDATFVTSFWCAFWLLWFNENVEDEKVLIHGRVLAQCIVGMIFMAGFIGKLTPEYISGDVIHQIFIQQGANSPFSSIVAAFGFSDYLKAAAVISVMIIIGEGLLATLPLWPYRKSFIVFMIIVPVITVFSTWRILSVLACLIGIMVGGLILERAEKVS